MDGATARTKNQTDQNGGVHSSDVLSLSDPPVLTVKIRLCQLCLDGDGDACHTPGCALFLHSSPGFPIAPELFEIVER